MKTKYCFSKNIRIILNVLVIFFLAVSTAYSVPLLDTIEFNGHYYLLVVPSGGITWDNAQAHAASETVVLNDGTVMKGHLVTINSQAEQDFVSNTFLTGSWQQLWLGGYQYSEEDENADNWAWVTCEEVGNIITDWSYQFLDAGQPDNHPYPEDALRMLIFFGNKWHDFPHTDNQPADYLRYVIEFDDIGDKFISLDAPPACVVTIEIDIKPGSYPNCFNNNGHGVIPVAILGSEDLDVTQIVIDDNLRFEGMAVRIKGNQKQQCSFEDVSGNFSNTPAGEPDGFLDLVCHFVDEDGVFSEGSSYGTVTGFIELENGTLQQFKGQDTVCITQ